MKISNKSLEAGFNPENQQLVSLKLLGNEYMHGGGKTAPDKTADDREGWQNSEIIMFPIVGPPKNHTLKFKESKYPMDQHGISRCISFEVAEQSSENIVFIQRYDAGTKISNPKHGNDSARPENLVFPYGYELKKEFSLDDKTLKVKISVKNCSELEMPFQIGWHPAFRLIENGKVTGETFNYSIHDVKNASKNNCSLHIPSNKVTYGNDEQSIVLESGMGLTQVWCPGGMICLEPVTHFETSGFPGFETLHGLKPDETRTFFVNITLH